MKSKKIKWVEKPIEQKVFEALEAFIEKYAVHRHESYIEYTCKYIFNYQFHVAESKHLETMLDMALKELILKQWESFNTLSVMEPQRRRAFRKLIPGKAAQSLIRYKTYLFEVRVSFDSILNAWKVDLTYYA